MFIRCAEANWYVLHFSTFVPDNISSLERLRKDLENEEREGAQADANDVLDDEAENNVVDGPTVLAHVELARTIRKYIASSPRF
jgi:hypothetical protein